MSDADAEAYQQGLLEQVDSLFLTIGEKAERLIRGDEAWEHSVQVSAEVRRIEREHMRDQLLLARQISERNRRGGK